LKKATRPEIIDRYITWGKLRNEGVFPKKCSQKEFSQKRIFPGKDIIANRFLMDFEINCKTGFKRL